MGVGEDKEEGKKEVWWRGRGRKGFGRGEEMKRRGLGGREEKYSGVGEEGG
jgi:hypothetical protein